MSNIKLKEREIGLFKAILNLLKQSSGRDIERKKLKNYHKDNKIGSIRGFCTSLEILEGLELISKTKIGVSHAINITEKGKEEAKKIYGGNK